MVGDWMDDSMVGDALASFDDGVIEGTIGRLVVSGLVADGSDLSAASLNCDYSSLRFIVDDRIWNSTVGHAQNERAQLTGEGIDQLLIRSMAAAGSDLSASFENQDSDFSSLLLQEGRNCVDSNVELRAGVDDGNVEVAVHRKILVGSVSLVRSCADTDNSSVVKEVAGISIGTSNCDITELLFEERKMAGNAEVNTYGEILSNPISLVQDSVGDSLVAQYRQSFERTAESCTEETRDLKGAGFNSLVGLDDIGFGTLVHVFRLISGNAIVDDSVLSRCGLRNAEWYWSLKLEGYWYPEFSAFVSLAVLCCCCYLESPLSVQDFLDHEQSVFLEFEVSSSLCAATSRMLRSCSTIE
jgi:hypothetical protein